MRAAAHRFLPHPPMLHSRSIMKANPIFTITALALAAGGAFAEPAAPLTRHEVKQEVLAARASGTLRHAGDAGPEERTPERAQIEAPSMLTRADGKSAVLAARAAHQLAHAGAVAPEEEMAYARAHPSASTMTRAEVRLQVVEARANGTLIPPGQGESFEAPRTTARLSFAKAKAPGADPVAPHAN
jgi:hypothetical protein